MFPGEKEFLERLVKDVTKLIEEDLQTLPEFYHEYYRHVMEPLLNRMFSSASIKRSPLSEDDSRNSEQSLLRCYEAMIKCRQERILHLEMMNKDNSSIKGLLIKNPEVYRKCRCGQPIICPHNLSTSKVLLEMEYQRERKRWLNYPTGFDDWPEKMPSDWCATHREARECLAQKCHECAPNDKHHECLVEKNRVYPVEEEEDTEFGVDLF